MYKNAQNPQILEENPTCTKSKDPRRTHETVQNPNILEEHTKSYRIQRSQDSVSIHTKHLKLKALEYSWKNMQNKN